MKVLVACEYSGTVRDAFSRAGHDAWSCDILPTESELTIKEGKHIQGDAIGVLHSKKWDLLIAHPMCTYLANSGVRWLYERDNSVEERERVRKRWEELKKAREFFLEFYDAPIKKICVENPIPHSHASLPPYTQTVQPWEFGEWQTKRTCLWLKGLPPLKKDYAKVTECAVALGLSEDAKPEAKVHLAPPSKDRSKIRSVFFKSIAKAMAEQWG